MNLAAAAAVVVASDERGWSGWSGWSGNRNWMQGLNFLKYPLAAVGIDYYYYHHHHHHHRFVLSPNEAAKEMTWIFPYCCCCCCGAAGVGGVGGVGGGTAAGHGGETVGNVQQKKSWWKKERKQKKQKKQKKKKNAEFHVKNPFLPNRYVQLANLCLLVPNVHEPSQSNRVRLWLLPSPDCCCCCHKKMR